MNILLHVFALFLGLSCLISPSSMAQEKRAEETGTVGQEKKGDDLRAPTFQRRSSTEFNLLSQRLKYLRTCAMDGQDFLELVDAQKAEVNKLWKEYETEIVESARQSASSFTGDNLSEFLREKTRILRQLNDRAMSQILLPHQTLGLLQHEFQLLMVAARDNVMAVVAQTGAITLGISEDQEKEILDKAKQLTDEVAAATKRYEEEIAAIKARGEEGLREILTPEQFQKLESMMGPGPLSGARPPATGKSQTGKRDD